MRPYSDKKNVQAKSYYNDRYWVAPQVPKSPVEEDEVFAADLAAIKAKFEVLDAYIQVGQMVVIINADDNYGVLQTLKDECAYTQLSEMSAIDWLADKGQFEVFYQLLSMSKRKRVRVKCFTAPEHAIESVNPLFRSADWSEREAYDMFGLKINNHPYMKRILMPDDWQGHPLLKTYPLEGDEFAAWYEVDKIFGKEARDIIGPENRDCAMVDRYDTERFARLGHEVPRGAEPKESKGPEGTTTLAFQEENGVFLIEEFKEEKQVVIDDRHR
jgi:NADH-quinone oxidoreductase subunit C